MFHRCIASGCNNSSDMEVRSWYRLVPMEKQDLLSKQIIPMLYTKARSVGVDFKTRFILPEFCFVKEKQLTQLPKEGKLVIPKT